MIEDYLEASRVPFVALRPGAFVGAWDLWRNGLKKGRLLSFGSSTARWTNIHVDDVAHYLALSVDEPRAVGQRINLGMDRPVSTKDMAAGFSNRQIAEKLILSEGTVKFHVHNILEKIRVHSRTQAIAKTRDLNPI